MIIQNWYVDTILEDLTVLPRDPTTREWEEKCDELVAEVEEVFEKAMEAFKNAIQEKYGEAVKVVYVER